MAMPPSKVLFCGTGRRGEKLLRLLSAQNSFKISLFDPKAPSACSQTANTLKITLLPKLPQSPFPAGKYAQIFNTVKNKTLTKQLSSLCPEGTEIIQPEGAQMLIEAFAQRQDLERYKTIVEHLPFRLFMKNKDLKFVYMNKKMAQDSKITIQQSKSETITDKDIYPEEHANKYNKDDRTVMRSGKIMEIKEPFKTQTETQTVITVKVPVRDSNGNPSGVLGFFEDITKEEELKQTLTHNDALQILLTEISTGFINLPFNEMDKGINSALTRIGTFCNANRVYVYTSSDTDSNLLINTHEWCKPELRKKYTDFKTLKNSHFPTAHKIITKKHVFRLPKDFKNLTKREQSIYQKHNISSLLQIPMISNGKLIGLLGLDAPNNNYIETENFLHLMQTAGEMFTQVLQQQKIAKALTHEKKFVEGIIDTANVIILLLDKKRRILQFNKYMEEISGYSSQEMQGKDWFTNFIPKDIRQNVLPLYKKAINGTCHTRGNINPIKTKSGTLRYVEWYDTTLKDNDGNTQGIIAIGHDITERLKAENALRKSEQKLRLFAENSADVIWTMDKDLNYIYISPSCAQLLGYTPQELIKLETDSTRNSEDFQKAAKKLITDEDTRQQSIRMEIKQKRKDTTYFWTEIVVNQAIDDHGQVIGLSGITRDITERKEAASKLNEYRFHLEELVKNKTKQLRESNEFNSTIIENIPSAIMVLDRNFNIAMSNSKLSKLFQTYDNINGRALQSIIRCYREPDYKRLFITLNKVLQGKLNSAEIEIVLPIHKSRQSLRCHISTMLPRREKLLVVIEDITQHKSLEQHLLFAERLAATGRLAASFAHEINNPLQGMATHLDILFEDRNNSHTEQESYECIRENIDRIARIVKQLMHTKKASEHEYTTTCVDDLVNKVVALMENNIRVKGIDLKYNPVIQHILVHGSDTQLHQAILNLVINAMDSMEKGGELTISVTTDKRNVYVMIKDTGQGIREKDIELIFDPFFTKKKTGGSGLGLFVCQNIALMHKGNITVESKYGKGSTFTLSLPLQTSQNSDSTYITPGAPIGNMPDFLN